MKKILLGAILAFSILSCTTDNLDEENNNNNPETNCYCDRVVGRTTVTSPFGVTDTIVHTINDCTQEERGYVETPENNHSSLNIGDCIMNYHQNN